MIETVKCCQEWGRTRDAGGTGAGLTCRYGRCGLLLWRRGGGER